MIKNKYFILITLIGLFVRLLGFDFISNDMKFCLLPWFNIINDSGGLNALTEQVGDYGLLYQTIIALMTYVDINPVYQYKVLSVVFDFLLAFSIAFFIYSTDLPTIFPYQNRTIRFCLTYACVLFMPTVILNSAFWGQCDSIYSCFLLWGLCFLYKRKFKDTFFMLGCALSFKLQTVLLFPLFLFHYFLKKQFSLFNFIITFATFWLSGIVAYLYGRNILDGINIYLYQVGEYKSMWLNVPSFWVLVGNDYDRYHLFAISLTIVLLGIGFGVFLYYKQQIDSFSQLIILAIFVEWTCILFLPSMHERYTYVLDLLLLILSILDSRCVKYAVIAIGTSCITYSSFLFRTPELNSLLIITYIAAWWCFLGEMYFERNMFEVIIRKFKT